MPRGHAAGRLNLEGILARNFRRCRPAGCRLGRQRPEQAPRAVCHGTCSRQGVRCEHGSGCVSKWRRLTGEHANQPAGLRAPREEVVVRHVDEPLGRPRSPPSSRSGRRPRWRLPHALRPPQGTAERSRVAGAMSMLNFSSNRTGRGLSAFRTRTLKRAKSEGHARRSCASDNFTPARSRRSP
jgi:uncharacterized protein DUF3175